MSQTTDRKKTFSVKEFLLNSQSYIALVAIFIIGTLICVKNGRNLFLSLTNFMNLLRAVSETGILAIGMTMIILLGDIDLSVGSVVALVSTGSAALMVHNGWGFVPTVLACLCMGAAYGLFNGLVVTQMKIQAFVVTLASMNIARGLARLWSGGAGIPLTYGIGEGLAAPEFEFFCKRLGGVVPVPAIIFLSLLLIFWGVMSKTRFGRQIYAVGGNSTAAHLSGIKVKRVRTLAFVISGVLASIAGMIHSAQISQGGPNEGMSYEMYAIAAVAIGGTSMAGGKGTMLGTLVGALIFGMLDNVMGLKGINSNIQLVVKGFLIILSVFAQAVRKED
ncbi:MAG: ABC transporter permease [Clostridiales bacterium]|nr:ABC transporter permease [Clostridiales bacterium]